jgi:hypothetical protein
LARIGGLEHIRISALNGDRTEYTAEITSLGADGSATSGIKATTTKAKSVRTAITNDGYEIDRPHSECWWGNAEIAVNTTELSDNILSSARNGGSVRDPKLWVRLIDKGLKQGIRSSIREQLLGNVSVMSKCTLEMAVALTPIYAMPDFSSTSIAECALFSSVFQQVIDTEYDSHGRGISLSERRLSLIPAYQIDRFFIANCITRARRLASPLKARHSNTKSW